VFLLFSGFLFFCLLWFLGSMLQLLYRQQTKHQLEIIKGQWFLIRKEHYNNIIYESTLITSNERIYTQHGRASTYILHVHKVHVVHYIHPEYLMQPTALHVRVGVVVLLWGELRPQSQSPSSPLFVWVRACTFVNKLLYTYRYIIYIIIYIHMYSYLGAHSVSLNRKPTPKRPLTNPR